ncbi:hypothetical protein CYMTET_27820, partial [Cymbomonas tetramitiformis]
FWENSSERYPKLDKIRFCHQLDFATSGLLLAAKSQKAAGAVGKLFKTREISKQYMAIVYGHPKEDKWTIEAPIGKDENDPKGFKMCVLEGAKDSITDFEVLQRGYYTVPGKAFGAEVSKVLVKPRTGRRHQIRVHLQQSGHPIVGDAAYADDSDAFRMFLLAHKLYVPLKDRPLDLTVEPLHRSGSPSCSRHLSTTKPTLRTIPLLSEL